MANVKTLPNLQDLRSPPPAQTLPSEAEHALASQGINNPDILEHLGDTYSKLGDAAKAQTMWRNALQKREAAALKLRQPAIIERLQQKLAAQPN
jgi:uncharacterized protein HemY